VGTNKEAATYLVDAHYGGILGCHIVGPEATQLLAHWRRV
jgi:hypothetical protein